MNLAPKLEIIVIDLGMDYSEGGGCCIILGTRRRQKGTEESDYDRFYPSM